jgi:alkylation response protein AidB-like acyl-CoA dehydrogenase
VQLDFTPEQDELRDGMRAMLTNECPMALVREVFEKGIRPDALWAHMVELGWPALTVPETAGGLGLGAVELAVVVEELGRVMAPGPFLATVTEFAAVVHEVGDDAQRHRFLGTVAAGETTGALAIAEGSGSFDPAQVTATATTDGDDVVLAGTKHFVLDGATADEVAVVARAPGTTGDDGLGAYVVPGSQLAAEPIAALDRSRPIATVALDHVRVPRDRVLGVPGEASAPGLRRAVEEATVALALEIVGTCQTIFDVSLEYAKHREQFGVAIGSFQAIKHKFADMAILLERARATGYFAALTIAEDDDRRSIATSMAKAAAGDAQARIAKEGIQVHGGIGYTWEHDMHLWVRRVTSNAALFGTAAEHRARVATTIGL